MFIITVISITRPRMLTHGVVLVMCIYNVYYTYIYIYIYIYILIHITEPTPWVNILGRVMLITVIINVYTYILYTEYPVSVVSPYICGS